MPDFILILIGSALTLGLIWLVRRSIAFRAQSPEDYKDTAPHFDLRQHLNGPIICEGVIYGPTGRVSSRFVADFEAAWDGNKGWMTEEFRYDNGSTQSRRWDLTIGDDGSIKAEAPDLIGTGTGMQKGAGVVLNYKIKLAESAGGHVLDATDWMYLMENGSIMNRSQFRKFGVTVAELVATMRPKEAKRDLQEAA